MIVWNGKIYFSKSNFQFHFHSIFISVLFAVEWMNGHKTMRQTETTECNCATFSVSICCSTMLTAEQQQHPTQLCYQSNWSVCILLISSHVLCFLVCLSVCLRCCFILPFFRWCFPNDWKLNSIFLFWKGREGKRKSGNSEEEWNWKINFPYEKKSHYIQHNDVIDNLKFLEYKSRATRDSTMPEIEGCQWRYGV